MNEEEIKVCDKCLTSNMNRIAKKKAASFTLNKCEMDAFVHLRRFEFLAFSKALLNEVCRAHPKSL